MADISKRLEKAEKYLQKGKVDSALEEYLSVLDVDPGNDKVRHTAADLFLQINRTQEAAALLSELFDRELALGDNTQASVTYKKLARIAPPKLGQTLRFAQAAERSGYRREAMEAYNAAVNGFLQEGRENEALSAMRRLAALDPDPRSLQRLADLASKLNDRQTSGDVFLKMGISEEEQGRPGFSWFERAHQHDPTNPNAAFRFGKALLDRGKIDQAVQALEAAGTAQNSLPEYRKTYGLALLAAHRPKEALPILWNLYLKAPTDLNEMGTLLGELLSQQNYKEALDLARKIDTQQQRLDARKEFAAFLRDVTESHPPDAEFLVYLSELFNATNREHDYCDALIQLFQLRYAAGDFNRAADALDRATDADPYLEGGERRLELLRGKIDANRYRSIAGRLQKAGAEPAMDDEPSEPEIKALVDAETEPTVLEDLMLQAEIFMQYSMRAKALERLERIQKLFPHEEKKTEKLRQLYVSAGVVPQYGKTSSNNSAAPEPTVESISAPAGSTPGGEDAVDNFARITEITRNIYRQSNVKGVLFAAVNDIGRHWGASRCVAGLCTPGKPPSAALEYCAPGVKQSDVMAIVRLIAVVQGLAVERGPVVVEDAAKAPELQPLGEHLKALDLKSVLACPLTDGDQHVGILILEQTDKRRVWKSTDITILKTIADQIVLAVNNAKLRNLMKTLAVTDENSGLLKRASYIDVTMAEVKRSLQQNVPLTLMLLNFGKVSTLSREAGESALETLMQNLGQSIAANIRQTDIAVRYDRTTIALILGDTKDTNSSFVIEKFRKVISGTKVPGTENPISMTVGIAGAVIQKEYDPVDIVTEVINRAEQALDVAHSRGANSAHVMAPIAESAVVA
jgi:diguanylate cyclase (GGDEF)-like protein